jgi:hypothetical protein
MISCETELVPAAEIVEFDQGLFDRERAAWNAANVKNYSFDMYVEGMASLSIIRFTVENGAFKELEIIETGHHDRFYQKGFTIPAFYAEIERTVQYARKYYEGKNPDEIRCLIEVVYNTRYHFPIQVSESELHTVGDNNFESDVANSGVKYSIRNFERLN